MEDSLMWHIVDCVGLLFVLVCCYQSRKNASQASCNRKAQQTDGEVTFLFTLDHFLLDL